MPATLILKEGQSGAGKSTGWENIPHEFAAIVTPNSKDLPFEGAAAKYIEGKNKITTNKMTMVPAVLKELNKNPKIKFIMVEDFTHYMNARTTDPAFIARKAGGDAFAKWNEFAADTLRVVAGTAEEMRDDVFVIINAHTALNDDGEWVLQTAGKLLDSSINIVSYFTYILHADVDMVNDQPQYIYYTNKVGNKQAKTPKNCFKDLKVPNDDYAVIKRIAEFQGKKIELK